MATGTGPDADAVSPRPEDRLARVPGAGRTQHGERPDVVEPLVEGNARRSVCRGAAADHRAPDETRQLAQPRVALPQARNRDGVAAQDEAD